MVLTVAMVALLAEVAVVLMMAATAATATAVAQQSGEQAALLPALLQQLAHTTSSSVSHASQQLVDTLTDVIVRAPQASAEFAARVQKESALLSRMMFGAGPRPEIAYEPDALRDLCGIVEDKGYPCERYSVATEDGYFLGLFRIPYGIAGPSSERKPAVLLQHGVLDNAETWVLNWPKESLSYILADLGYDVWLGNNRGDQYSLNHATLNTNDTEFWNFSFDEMALFDLPAILDFVCNITGFDKIPMVGHSQGTSQVLAGLASSPHLASRLTAAALLAPVANVSNTKSPAEIIATLHMDEFRKLFGDKSFCLLPNVAQDMERDFCTLAPDICEGAMQLVMGWHEHSLNDSRMGVMGSYIPGSTSVENLNHWCQLVRDGQFKKRDMGSTEKNIEKYGQDTPPIYDFSRIDPNLPLFFASGGKDLIADPLDVQHLIDDLPTVDLKWMQLPQYNHMDFVWCKDAYADVYPYVVEWVTSHPPQ
eukprot:TRINITY_DN17_c0_g2_i1.p1 TRINITY_DN17_c0_g2~~TRINITY_DN17_c0_g2_i1.p1  ORF type:complete len:480 (-),score=122.19 TRINITY_DN17_c0_g2_i1:61-1500(-)